MPIPERYYREVIAKHEVAERQARGDTRREWVRVLGEMAFWTALGLVGIALAWRTLDVDLGWIYWWSGALVWVAGVCAAVLTAHLRGQKRGDWR